MSTPNLPLRSYSFFFPLVPLVSIIHYGDGSTRYEIYLYTETISLIIFTRSCPYMKGTLGPTSCPGLRSTTIGSVSLSSNILEIPGEATFEFRCQKSHETSH